jgi:hypothetical protein
MRFKAGEIFNEGWKDSWIGGGLRSLAFEPLANGVVGMESDEPFRIGAIGIDRRHEPSAKRLFTMSHDGMELRQLQGYDVNDDPAEGIRKRHFGAGRLLLEPSHFFAV